MQLTLSLKIDKIILKCVDLGFYLILKVSYKMYKLNCAVKIKFDSLNQKILSFAVLKIASNKCVN